MLRWTHGLLRSWYRSDASTHRGNRECGKQPLVTHSLAHGFLPAFHSPPFECRRLSGFPPYDGWRNHSTFGRRAEPRDELPGLTPAHRPGRFLRTMSCATLLRCSKLMASARYAATATAANGNVNVSERMASTTIPLTLAKNDLHRELLPILKGGLAPISNSMGLRYPIVKCRRLGL